MNRVPILAVGLLMMAIFAPLAWGGALPLGADDVAPADVAAGVPAEVAAAGPTTTAAAPIPARPAVGVALPSDAGPFTTIVFDDFEWCQAPSCPVAEADPLILNVQQLAYRVTPTGSWAVNEGVGRGGSHAVEAVQGGGFMDIHLRATGGMLGSQLVISFAAKGPVLGVAESLQGGLEVQVTQRLAGLVVGAMDCAFVPVVPAGDGFVEYIAANPGCMVAPYTTEIWIHLLAHADADGQVPEIAIDDLVIQHIEL